MSKSRPLSIGRQPTRKRWVLRVTLALAVIAMVAEIGARYGLGLGDPPLLISHPTIEYLAQPNQDRMRFGNRIVYNQFSMRSESDWSPRRDAGQLRVLIVGDSIINGGNLTDQAELATTLLENRLRAEGHDRAIVGNVSAGSWGIPNQLAYVRNFGLFDAQIVLLVLSSGDAYDIPTFKPLDPIRQPTKSPKSAFIEGFRRYLWPRLFTDTGRRHSIDEGQIQSEEPDDPTESLNALRAFVAAVKQAKARLVVIHHAAKDRLGNSPALGTLAMQEALAELDVPQISDHDALLEATESGSVVYRDHLHFNAAGQQVLAELFAQAVSLAQQSHASVEQDIQRLRE